MSTWNIPVSKMGENTINPIRDFSVKSSSELIPNPNLELISLRIGDPTIFGNLNPDATVVKALENSVKSGKFHGYTTSQGHKFAREAVANYLSTPKTPLAYQDVILTSGCSGATEIALGALADSGDNILAPQPGYHQVSTIGTSYGIEIRFYNLLPERLWEADIESMESLIDERTRCIFVTNPSNPCGSVYNEKHLKEILAVAEKYKLPIVVDEVYGYMVFKGETFHPIASLTETVPVLSLGALTKRFLVPGWRLGWILIHDRNGAFEKVRQGLFNLSNRILGPNTIVQGALPEIFSNPPVSLFKKTMEIIENNADIAYTSLSKVPGLHPVKPKGAMFIMVGIDKMLYVDTKDDTEFTIKLLQEKAVYCLPGITCMAPNFLRVVLTIPEEKLITACERIRDFCREILSSSKACNGK